VEVPLRQLKGKTNGQGEIMVDPFRYLPKNNNLTASPFQAILLGLAFYREIRDGN